MIRLKNLFLELMQMSKEIKKTKKTVPFVQIEFKIPKPTEEEIRLLAYHKWELSQENKPSEQYWQEAEEELIGNYQENKCCKESK